jgi:hypothetical protein
MSRMRPAPLLAAALLLMSLAACGDGTEGASASTSSASGTGVEVGGERAGTPQTVDCPDEASAMELPEDFPAPLPPGSVVVAVQERDDGRTVVTAVVPQAEPDVLAGLQTAYPDAGLTLTEGETEERDAESNFSGDAATGRWGIRELADCSTPATRIDVVVRLP